MNYIEIKLIDKTLHFKEIELIRLLAMNKKLYLRGLERGKHIDSSRR